MIQIPTTICYLLLLPFVFFLYKWYTVPYLEHLNQKFPVIKTAYDYAKIRQYMKKDGQVSRLLGFFEKMKIVDHYGMLTVEAKKGMPFNVFAMIGSGEMCPPGHKDLQKLLPVPVTQTKFMVCGNRPCEDDKWNDKHASSGSMSRWHKFLILTTLDWKKFNVLIMGTGSKKELEICISMLTEMRKVAEHVATEAGVEDLGLFVHCCPHNSVQALHIHMLDMTHVGHWFDEYSYKNLPLDAVIDTLECERKSM
tara:strand:- start:4702 stop:5457 length:756 start_codon:yes stop_codon:yes gene_type:complete